MSRSTRFLFVRFCFNAIQKFYTTSKLCDNFRFNAKWHKRYAIICGLTRFGRDDKWPHSSCSWRLVESDVIVTPSVKYMDWLLWWYNRAAYVVPLSTKLGFVTKMNEKRKYTALSAAQTKNRRQENSTKEKLDVISRHGKVNELLTHAVLFDSFIVAYVL